LPFATPSTFRLYDLDQEEVYFSPNAEMTRSSHERQDHDLPNNISNGSDSTFNEYSFFDEAVIYVRSGSGGQGSSTFKKGAKGQNAQPDGGNGGRGGDVYLVADESLNTLAGLNNAWRPNSFGGSGAVASSDARAIRPLSFRADNGEDGGRQFTNGRFGKDIKILVPPGTLVQEEIDVKQICEDTGEEITLETRHVDIGTVELSDTNNILLVARGGEGGEGNGAQSKFGRGVRRPRAPSIGGEKKRLKLTLKIVADVALVGVSHLFILLFPMIRESNKLTFAMVRYRMPESQPSSRLSHEPNLK
jgi:GTP-binding protein